jgi:hypothetical protein
LGRSRNVQIFCHPSANSDKCISKNPNYYEFCREHNRSQPRGKARNSVAHSVAKYVLPAVQDKITDFQDGIVNELVRLGYSNLLNKRIYDNEVYGFWGGKEYNKEIFDELIRVPDYISGAIASMDFDDVDKTPEKHYNLFDKSIIDNERICIMGLEHHQSEDILGEIKFTRHSPLSQ